MKKAALLAALLVLRAAAEDAPEYRPRTRISGTLRAWGSAQMEDLLKLWETGFQRFHPAARFENHTYGAVSALGGLYAGGGRTSPSTARSGPMKRWPSSRPWATRR